MPEGGAISVHQTRCTCTETFPVSSRAGSQQRSNVGDNYRHVEQHLAASARNMQSSKPARQWRRKMILTRWGGRGGGGGGGG